MNPELRLLIALYFPTKDNFKADQFVYILHNVFKDFDFRSINEPSFRHHVANQLNCEGNKLMNVSITSFGRQETHNFRSLHVMDMLEAVNDSWEKDSWSGVGRMLILLKEHEWIKN